MDHWNIYLILSLILSIAIVYKCTQNWYKNGPSSFNIWIMWYISLVQVNTHITQSWFKKNQMNAYTCIFVIKNIPLILVLTSVLKQWKKLYIEFDIINRLAICQLDIVAEVSHVVTRRLVSTLYVTEIKKKWNVLRNRI